MSPDLGGDVGPPFLFQAHVKPYKIELPKAHSKAYYRVTIRKANSPLSLTQVLKGDVSMEGSLTSVLTDDVIAKSINIELKKG